MNKVMILALGSGFLMLAGCSLEANPQKAANMLNELSCGSPRAGVYYNGKKVEPNKPMSAEAAQRCRQGGAKMAGTTVHMD